jgi:hypothetical protein
MATQTSREDTVGKAVEEQSTQGSVATVASPLPPTPMETQEIADVDGKEVESVHSFDVYSFFCIGVILLLAYSPVHKYFQSPG